MNESTTEYKLQEFCKAILAYQQVMDRCVEGGNDGGDVAELEHRWNELLENAKSILEGKA